MSARILVTDGDQRSALAIVRSLGRSGFDVVACGTASAITLRSKFARHRERVPDPSGDTATFVEAVSALAERYRPDLVIPTTEASVPALVEHRDALGPARLPYPSLDVVRKVGNKAAVLGVASAIGIRVPRQAVLSAPGALVPPDMFPVAVKPARSLHMVNGELHKRPTAYAPDRASLEAILADFPSSAYPVLVQQRIVGPGTGLFFLRWDDQILAHFAHRRIREKPPAGGVSVCSESVAAPPELVERSQALLAELGWQGVAMVEYKIDARTGVPYLMEINGRFWGSLQLAIDSGVDFPSLLARAALGDRVNPVTTYRTGVRTRWWWGDIDHLLARLRKSATSLALPPGSPGRLHVAADVLLPRGGQHNEVLRWNDPLPFVRETINWLRGR